MRYSISDFVMGLGSLLGMFSASNGAVHEGAGTARRLEREAAYRTAQAERLKDAAPPRWTRQLRRQNDRLISKGRFVTLQ